MEDTHSSYPLRYSNGGGHAPQGSFGDGGPTSSAGQSRPYYAGVAEVQDAGVDPGYGGSYAGSHVGHSSVPHSIAPPRPYYPARAPEIMQEDDQGPRGSAGAGMLGWGTEAGGRGSGGLYGARMPATSEGQSSWSGLATEGGAYPSRPAA